MTGIKKKWLKGEDISACSLLKVKRRFGGTYRLHFQCRRISQRRHQREAGSKQSWCMVVSSSAYSWTLYVEGRCSSETSVDFQRTKRRYITKDGILHNHRCDNLRSYNVIHYLNQIKYNLSTIGNTVQPQECMDVTDNQKS
jgi:hypothetical protein